MRKINDLKTTIKSMTSFQSKSNSENEINNYSGRIDRNLQNYEHFNHIRENAMPCTLKKSLKNSSSFLH